MAGGLLLGIDVGTTYCKAGVVTLDGVERAHGRARTPWRREGAQTDIDPWALLDAALSAAREALAQAADGQGRVIAVGVTSMAETGTLLDRAGRPLVPAIAWHDPRGREEIEELVERFGAGSFASLTGLAPKPMWSVAKYRWLRSHRPESASGTRWLNVAEWVVSALGGDQVADISLASRTGLLDLNRRRFSPELLELAGAPGDLMPELAESGTPAGRVTRGLDEARGAVLTVAGHDHSCAAVGAGATGPGDVFDSCGTAEAFVRGLDPPSSPEDIERAHRGGVNVVWHALPGRQALLGGFASGLLLQGVLERLGAVSDDAARERLDRAAMALGHSARPPEVSRAAEVEAMLADLPRGPTPAEDWRTALEAVAAGGAAVLRTIESVAGATGRLVVTGGGARSPALRWAKRRALGDFDHPSLVEPGARGAALLAGCAAGTYAGPHAIPPPPPADPPERAPARDPAPVSLD